MNSRERERVLGSIRNRKEMHISQKRNRRMRRKNSSHAGVSLESAVEFCHTYRVDMPSIFSLVQNSNETIKFFNSVLDIIEMCRCGDRIYYNMAKVTKLSVDAAIYFLAIIREATQKKSVHFIMHGGPLDNDITRTLKKLRFFILANYPKKEIEISGENRIMRAGIVADGKLASNLCNFVNSRKMRNRRLYSTLVELMENTNLHAYRDDAENDLEGNWYIFAEKADNSINFTFLDTGEGIPNTIRKNLFERFKETIVDKFDAEYIVSALKGENRTETRMTYRGKGLPDLYQDMCDGAFEQMNIISGKGKCSIYGGGEIDMYNLRERFAGTIFCWSIKTSLEQ